MKVLVEWFDRWRKSRILRDLPPVFEKATVDPFQYLIVLSNGAKIRCEEIQVHNKEWIYISGESILPESFDGVHEEHPLGDFPERGVYIKIAHIVAMVDAPDGS